MFRGKHALLQGCGCVAALYRYLGLAQHFAGVELLRDDVYRTTAYLIARFDCAGMGVETAIFREQGRVDVDDPSAPLLDEPGGKDAHEAGERDCADIMFLECGAQQAIISPFVEPFAVEAPGLQRAVLCPGETCCVGFV